MLFRNTRVFSQNAIFLLGLAALLYIFFNLSIYLKSNFRPDTRQLFHCTEHFLPSICPKRKPFHKFPNTSWTDVSKNLQLVLVFLHIQKSAGTFIEKQFTRSGVRDFPCACRSKVKVCDCKKNNRIWLFCRYSVGWRCGLHADYTELSACVPQAVNKLEKRNQKRTYAYFTILRDPIQRYLSEWQHIRRGATWRSATLHCNGQEPTESEYKPCYLSSVYDPRNFSTQSIWKNVSLDEFTSCKFNLANNRQTRMLASLDKLDCYAKLTEWSNGRSDALSSSSRAKLLRSAIANLATQFVVFGLAEYPIYTQYMYQSVFGIVFKKVFMEPNMSHLPTHAELAQRTLPIGWENKVSSRNLLDLELIEFAHRLFSARLAVLILSDSRLPGGFRRLLRSLSMLSVYGNRTLLFDLDFKKRAYHLLFRLLRRQKCEALSLQADEVNRRYWNLKLKKDFNLAGM